MNKWFKIFRCPIKVIFSLDPKTRLWNRYYVDSLGFR